MSAQSHATGGMLGKALTSVSTGLTQRILSVGYGFVYDAILEASPPYQTLVREVLGRVTNAVPSEKSRTDIKVLDADCGPGSVSVLLAREGFSVIGIDRYPVVIDLAREKRRAERLTNLAFRQGDLADGTHFRGNTFDFVVNIHSLYAHQAPARFLVEIRRVLKPGGHAVIVNPSRRLSPWNTFRGIGQRNGFPSALKSLLWLLPNGIFESARRPAGPHYWEEHELTRHLSEAGLEVVTLGRTFFEDASVVAWIKRPEDT